MRVLAGDIGGTKTLLQIAEVGESRIDTLHQDRFVSQDYPDFESLLRNFLQAAPSSLRKTVAAACFGVAGPVIGPEDGPRSARITNLPWFMHESELGALLQLSRVRLINDFYAIANGIETLGENDLAMLNPGSATKNAARLVVGAGTGLGVAHLMWCEHRYHAFPSEGGHIHFAPTDALQLELLNYMSHHHDRVSYERLVSGAGLVIIYRFLLERHKEPDADILRRVLECADPPATITALSRNGDSVAQQAVSLFLRIYGALVGDLALVSLAYGGIFIAGGIAPKLLFEMREGAFMTAYSSKGRMSDIVMKMPIFVVLSQNIGLQGATLAASRL